MKKPFINKKQLEEIAEKYPTPFHIYSEKGIRETAQNLKKAFSWNKGFKEYFAVKATPNPAILKILRQEGCGVDCSSATELELSRRCGFGGDEIMFSSNATPAQEFVQAKNMGAIINLDDITHVEFLEKCAGIPKTICCRYNPGGQFTIHNKIMDSPKDAKYGMTKEQLKTAFLMLKEKGAKEFGVHAFLVSNTLAEDYYPSLARQLFELVAWLKKETGIGVSFVNLSGGVGIAYKPNEQAPNIFTIGANVKKAFDEIMLPAGLGDVCIFTELGRHMLGPNGQLVAKAVHKKEIYKNYIGLDACAANLMRPAVYGAYHHISVLGKEDAKEDYVYDVTGSLCENSDKFAIDRPLPKIEMGDYVVIHDTGAHGFAMGYNYNGKLRSAELLLKEDGTVQLIRRAETEQDYFATLEGFF